MRSLSVVVSLAAIVIGVWLLRPTTDLDAPSSVPPSLDTAGATQLLSRQPGFFVPNLGQWRYPAKFVHRSGPMTLFLEDRGWVIDLVESPAKTKAKTHEPGSLSAHTTMADDGEVDQKIRGVALRMTFEGDAHVPKIVGEKKLAGYHNYFLGNDERRWRTDVPRYASVLYEGMYPGIDLRLRQANGVPEYDLLLQPGADLSLVNVHVEGADDLRIAEDGSLVIDTAVGPVTQSVPKTWQVGGDGRKREVVCNFTLLGADRFGFAATGWDGESPLTIDPALIWSTYLGGTARDFPLAVSVDGKGRVTIAGGTESTNYPTTTGAYDTSNAGNTDAIISRLDPNKTGAAQLIYSTFLGGRAVEHAQALSVDANGVVTIAGYTFSTDYPTTSGAYNTKHNGSLDAVVSRLDPSKTGSAQLVYSTYLGGSGGDGADDLHVDSRGVVTVAGNSHSTDYPTTSGAFDTSFNSGTPYLNDFVISRLDPSKTGTAQLVYSTFLGGSSGDHFSELSVDVSGVVTVAGWTQSANFPTTSGAYDTTHNRAAPYYFPDVIISRLDPSKTGAAQLIYSTFLGGSGQDIAHALAVDAGGVLTVAGSTAGSTDYPTTSGAFDTTYNGTALLPHQDPFVSRLDPSKTGSAQLVYSTFLGGSHQDVANSLAVDVNGVVTVAGWTRSGGYPTTAGAYDISYNGSGSRYLADAFVSRLDPSKTGSAQLIYSTFLGGSDGDGALALAVDASGVVTVAGTTSSTSFPTTSGAFDTTYNGASLDTFVSRLDMGVALWADTHQLSLQQAGTQNLHLNAGKQRANKPYWIFGSATGTKPGVILNSVRIPLNPDLYTDLTITAANSNLLKNFKGTMDANGRATASFNVPSGLPPLVGFTLHHAFVVYRASGPLMASNAVPLRLK